MSLAFALSHFCLHNQFLICRFSSVNAFYVFDIAFVSASLPVYSFDVLIRWNITKFMFIEVYFSRFVSLLFSFSSSSSYSLIPYCWLQLDSLRFSYLNFICLFPNSYNRLLVAKGIAMQCIQRFNDLRSMSIPFENLHLIMVDFRSEIVTSLQYFVSHLSHQSESRRWRLFEYSSILERKKENICSRNKFQK